MPQSKVAPEAWTGKNRGGVVELEAVIWGAAGACFLAVFVRSIFGFGDGMVGMPLLVWLLGLRDAAGLVALLSLAVGVGLILPEWRALRFRPVLKLLAGAVCGIPVGILLLDESLEPITRPSLGLFVAGFAIWQLIAARRASPEDPTDKKPTRSWVAVVLGFLSGVFGGAYNIAGPPMVVFSSMQDWPPETFRANIQAFFLSTGCFVVLGHGLSGVWTPRIWTGFAVALPAAALAIALGIAIRNRIDPSRFKLGVYWLLLAMGAGLVFSGLKGVFS